MIVTPDQIDLNRTIHQCSIFSPHFERRSLDVVIVDTNTFTHSDGQQTIKQLLQERIPVYTTRGVIKEIKEIERYEQERKRVLFSKKTKDLVERLQAEGIILDVKTRGEHGHPLLEFENYQILYPLSRAMIKSILQEMIVERFEELYREVQHIYQRGQVQSMLKNAFFSFTDTIEEIVEKRTSRPFYRQTRIQEILGELERTLYSRIEPHVESVLKEIPWKAVRKEKYVMRVRDGNKAFNTTPFFEKCLRYMFHCLQRNEAVDIAKEGYKRQKDNRGSTDRKLLLAAYALIPLEYPTAGIGILTRDRDLYDLLHLRRMTTINYTNYQARLQTL